MFLYFDSRLALPARARRFIEPANVRLRNDRDFMLYRIELDTATAKGRTAT